jgi:hypothetical protein
MGSTQGNVVNRSDGTLDLNGLEDQCVFERGLCHEMGLTQGDAVTCSDGKVGWVCLLCVGG